MSGRVRMAVIGVGHFGRAHAEKIAGLDRAELVAVADRDPDRAAKVGRELGVRAMTDYRELLGGVDAVSVAVPTLAHYDVAAAFIAGGIHVLVEKPITHDVASARRLIDAAEAQGVVLQVGHLARFSGVTEAARQKIERPLYIECVRIAPFKPRGTDVNVVMDLMIHDLQVVLSVLDAPIVSVDAVGAPVLSTSEDIANARLKFETGCVANLTASRISLKTERKMRIFQADAYMTVDHDAETIRTMWRSDGGSSPAAPKIEFDETTVRTETDALEREIEAFLDAAIEGGEVVVSGEEGLRALDAALQINESLRAHAEFVRSAAAG